MSQRRPGTDGYRLRCAVAGLVVLGVLAAPGGAEAAGWKRCNPRGDAVKITVSVVRHEPAKPSCRMAWKVVHRVHRAGVCKWHPAVADDADYRCRTRIDGKRWRCAWSESSNPSLASGRARVTCYRSIRGRKHDRIVNWEAPPSQAPAPYITDDEAVDQIVGHLADVGAIPSTEAVVLWNEHPCERVSRGVVVCTYRYANSQGGWWERRTRVRETLTAFWLTDIYVKSVP